MSEEKALYRALSSDGTTVERAVHWLVVGYVSDGAREWIEKVGGRVMRLSNQPSLIAVALSYDPRGAWTWSKGQSQHRQGIEFWTSGEIQEASTGISLQYRSSDRRIMAEYCSAETNYIILPDEEFDVATGKVKEPEVSTEEPSTNDDVMEKPEPFDAFIDDLDDHLF